MQKNKNVDILSGKIERFSPDKNYGLSNEQVSLRQEQKLINLTAKKYSKSYLNIFVNNVCTFFNLLGLIVFVALLAINAPLANFVFAGVYLANLSIGIIQELRAKKCIDKLSIVATKNIKCIRNGAEVEILGTEIVLDDVLVLSMGNQIPTDCVVLEGNVEVNESLLTGESVPVKKKVGDNLLSGSFIVSGTCKVQAIKVGKENYVEQLSAKAKSYKKPKSELMDSLKLLIKTIGIIIVPIGTLYFIKSFVLLGVDLNPSILRTSTVVIGMIPSGMFLLTSLTLAVGIVKLAKHNTLVQDLYSLEMLARVDTICFDKTGTITDGKMTVKELVNLTEEDFDLNNIMSSMLGTLSDNNQTAIALFERFGQDVLYTAKEFIPFNSARKLSAVTFNEMGTFAFGAPEFVLPKDEYSKFEEQINSYAKQGLRVLVLAKSSSPINNDTCPTDFTAVALITLVDNVRSDAVDTISWFKNNGVDMKVISGDNPITVAEVSKRAGIPDCDKLINLEGLTDEEVYDSATKYTIFGRVSPEQKAILIRALKDAGHVTAMTGDGVNDILALKESDCAISVASGSDAARNLAHLVLLDNNFSSMPKVVYEGRRVINNVQSSASLYLMKTLFTMILAFATFLLPYMEVYPFELSQMNLLEIFVIGVPSFFLSMQPNDSKLEGNFINQVLKKSLPSALLMVISVAIIEIFYKTLGTMPIEVYRTMQIFALTFAGLISLYMISKPLNKYRFTLFIATLIVLLGVLLITIFKGLPALNFVILSPIKEYWHHLLLLFMVILVDVPLLVLFERICKKIKFNFKHK